MNEDILTKESICCAAEELGYHTLKPEQLDVVFEFVKRRDVIAVLPTGFGKSLHYACLLSTFDKIQKKKRGYSIVVVVTPLLAVMNNQVRVMYYKGQITVDFCYSIPFIRR